MILCDIEIATSIEHHEIGVEPYDETLLQPASLDMRLDRYFRFYDDWHDIGATGPVVDPKSPDRRTKQIEADEYVLRPQGFVLASTVEKVRFPSHMVGRIEGKSSLARMGVFIHVTAGFIDPGFEGYVTLEVFNGNPNPVKLYAGMPVCQMSFHRLGRSAVRPYGLVEGSKYQDQPQGPQESAYYKNFERETVGRWT